MSIKPIDYNVMLPKTQEISTTKHVENFKNRNIVDSGFVQQEKIINRNQKKVLDTEKGNNAKITDGNKSRNQEQSKKKKREKSEQTLDEEKVPVDLGNKIDIRI